MAQVAQLLADAQADARQAEGRVHTLQHRLRVEVRRPRASPSAPLPLRSRTLCPPCPPAAAPTRKRLPR